MKRHLRLQPAILPLVIWLTALGLRVGAALVLAGPPIHVSEAGQTAARLVAGQGYTFDFYGYREANLLRSFMPPLYSAVIAACMGVSAGNPELTLKLVQAVVSSLTTLIVFSVGVELFDRRVALLAATGVAVYPVFVIVVTQPTVTVVGTFLLALLIWTLLRLRHSRTLFAAMFAGLILGLNALNRPLILVFVVPILGWVWLQRADLSLPWVQAGTVVTLAATVTVTPWIVRNLVIHRAPVLISTNGGFTFWNGNNPFTTGSGFDVYADRLDAYLGQLPAARLRHSQGQGIVSVEPYPLPLAVVDDVDSLSEVELDRALYRAALEFIQAQPRRWLVLVAAKMRALWWFRPNIGTYRDFYQSSWIAPYKVMYGIVLVLAVGSTWLARQDWRGVALLYLLFGTMTAGYLSFNVITRYRWEMEPFLILLASVPIIRAGEWVFRKR